VNAEALARIRSEMAGLSDPASLLGLYADPAGRQVLRERVRSLSRTRLDDSELDGVCAELFGFGPLQRWLDDPDVTDVLVNGPDDIFVERDGKLVRTDAHFRDAGELADLVYRIAASVGRELTVERPFVDARMRDGSRANAVIEPVGGPSLSIRRFRCVSVSLAGPAPSWQASSGLSGDAVDWLRAAVVGRRNLLISGATGSGKSTFLRSLSSMIPLDERLVVIEDTNELEIPHPHVVHLECVPGRDGTGVRVADLVVNALRMRPDRIIVGEVRSPTEASALLEALSTGHDGAITTLHAGSAADALARLELLLARAGELNGSAVERHIRRAIDGVIHLVRRPGGARAVAEIATSGTSGLETVWSAASGRSLP
jgi:pilus assembly protein CpaF